MKHDTSLYMFALMPPPELSGTIHAIREDFSKKFKFKKALKPPVHITLFDPFQIPEASSLIFEQTITQMQQWASLQAPFNIDLRNYNFFNNPQHPVVYVDVIKRSSIKNFHSNFITELTKYKLTNKHPHSFTPHVTIGYRDVTIDAFPLIRAYYSQQTFSSSFTCNTFYLWKHNGANWQVIKTYYLDGKGEQLTLF